MIKSGLADFGDLFEHREQVLEAADFLFVNQDVSVFELGFHRFRVGDEVRGEIALVELHAFDHFEGGFDGLGFFDGDGAVFADFVHGVGDDFADGGVPVGGNGRDLLDFFLVLDLLGDLGEVFHGGVDGFLMPRWMPIGLAPAVTYFKPSRIDRFGQNGRGGGAVAGGVAGLAGDFADHLGAHVFIRVFQFDFLGHGHAVLGHGGRAEFFVEHHVAAFGAEGGVDGAAQFFDALQEGLTRGFVEYQLFCCHNIFICSWFSLE